MKIILASKSPRRKELLTNAGFDFEVIPTNVDERIDENLDVRENVKRLAYIKAEVLRKEYYNDIIIGADTIVVYNNEIYGKPKDRKDAFRMLKNLSNNTHQVISGVAIFYQEKVYNFAVTSEVKFKDLSDEDINFYIDKNECFDKAGSYAIQGLGKNLVDSFKGDLNNIIGLPITDVSKILKEIMGD